MDFNSLSPEGQEIARLFFLNAKRSKRRLDAVIEVLKPELWDYDKKDDSFTYLYEPTGSKMVDGIDIYIAFADKILNTKFNQKEHKKVITFLTEYFNIDSVEPRITTGNYHKGPHNYISSEGKYYGTDVIYYHIEKYMLRNKIIEWR